MNVKSKDSHNKIYEGIKLARIYLFDMVEEHFQYGGRKKELHDFFLNSPNLLNILEDDSIGDENLTAKWNYMKKKPIRFILKNRVKGVLHKFVKLHRKVCIIHKQVEKVKYPMML